MDGRWQWLRVSEPKWPSRGRPPKPHYLVADGPAPVHQAGVRVAGKGAQEDSPHSL